MVKKVTNSLEDKSLNQSFKREVSILCSLNSYFSCIYSEFLTHFVFNHTFYNSQLYIFNDAT